MTKRIKFCVVSDNLIDVQHGDMLFLQTPWCHPENPEWVSRFNFIRNSKYSILDNQHPATDKSTETSTPRELIDTAITLGVNEIILPDVVGDPVQTWVQSADFVLKYAPHFGCMYVLQGNTEEQMQAALTDLITNDLLCSFVTTIGLPKHFRARHDLIDAIPRRFAIHMLGCRSYGDFTFHPRIRSWDSSLPVAAAIAGVDLNGVEPTFKMPYVGGSPYDRDLFFRNLTLIRSQLAEERVQDEP